ncbi:MAG: hypothetical protein WAK44_10060 [Trebonia sp.]
MTSPGGRRGVLAALTARPNCSSICGSPGSLSWSRISSRVSGFSSGWVYRLANTHALAACSSRRCSACPACSQSARRSSAVSRTAVAAGGAPPPGSRPRSLPRSKSRCGSRPGSASDCPVTRAAAGTPSAAGRRWLLVHRRIPARSPGSRSARRAAATSLASRSAGRPSPTSTSVAPSVSASFCSPASSPGGSGSARKGPRWVCRCGTAASIRRSSSLRPMTLAPVPTRTRASSLSCAGSGSRSTTGRCPRDRTASRSPNSAAPQLISISLPIASSRVLRAGSAHSSTASASTRNRHGWLLWIDGARAAVAIRYRALPARSRACSAAPWVTLGCR